MISVIIIDHEDEYQPHRINGEYWAGPIETSTDHVRSCTVIHAQTGKSDTYINEEHAGA